MEDSRLIKLSMHRPKPTDLHLWKQQSSWYSDGNTTNVTVYQCPLKTKFDCPCQIRLTNNDLETRKAGNTVQHTIQPELARSVERHVHKFRAKLTEQKLDGITVYDSYGSLVL